MCGAVLAATSMRLERSSTGWIGYSVLLSAVIAIVAAILGLSGLYLFVAAFYGAMIASYQCDENVVLETSLGAVGGLLAAFLIVLVFESGAAKALATPATVAGSSSAVVMLYGLIVALPVAYLAGLVGAVCGETLSQRRLRRAKEVGL